MAQLTGSVGMNGINRPADVKLVQGLLNENKSKMRGYVPLAEDGKIGPKTIATIKQFQQQVVGVRLPDGRVDVGGRTFRTLTMAPVQTAPPKMGLVILNAIRKWETTESTISEFFIPGAQAGELAKGYFLERPGPDTATSGLRLRIPEGSYHMKWQTTTGLAGVRPHLPVPWLYSGSVSDARKIYIHNGNYPRNTDGCLLVGTSRSKDFVGASVEALKSLKKYLNRVGIENVQLKITSSYGT